MMRAGGEFALTANWSKSWPRSLSLKSPSWPKRKIPQDYQIVGMPIGHQDCPEIVDGSIEYGLDITLPDMLYATLLRCPVVRGGVAGFDASQVLAVPGVRQGYSK